FLTFFLLGAKVSKNGACHSPRGTAGPGLCFYLQKNIGQSLAPVSIPPLKIIPSSAGLKPIPLNRAAKVNIFFVLASFL
ncbi:MAG: hypothetical protein WC951_07500, partial [Bacteroidales bacterium]